jgi:hypothetical protein
MAIFFAITMKMTKSIKELDTMVYAMAKRVIEVDASLTAIGKTNSDFSEITEKQDEVITTQTQVAKRLEELGKTMAAMPTVVATEANKSSDLKFKDMQKQLTTMESKLQSFDGKLQTVAEKASARFQPPAPAAPQGPSTQVLLTEIQKIKADLNAAVQVRERTQTAAEAAAIKNIEKTIDKAAVAAGDAQKAADKAEAEAKAARIAAEIASRQQGAVDNFVLGQSAEDALAGQGDIFSAPAAPKPAPVSQPKTDTAPKASGLPGLMAICHSSSRPSAVTAGLSPKKMPATSGTSPKRR